ncbi:MAG: hypothetical protein PUE57_02385, partial [Lactimicrobium massiliense]
KLRNMLATAFALGYSPSAGSSLRLATNTRGLPLLQARCVPCPTHYEKDPCWHKDLSPIMIRFREEKKSLLQMFSHLTSI